MNGVWDTFEARLGRLMFAIAFGVMTLLLHAPVWMKIVHLGIAHIIWVILLQWVFFVRTHSVRLEKT